MLNHHFLFLSDEMLVDPSPFLGGASFVQSVRIKMELLDLPGAIGCSAPILFNNHA
jgi:hypothetical protein